MFAHVLYGNHRFIPLPPLLLPGLTESCAGSFVAIPNANQTGTVGVVFPNQECRLEAVPDMEYNPMGNPPRGEVCLRGPPIFSGYYKRPDLTKEALDEEGWLHTGELQTEKLGAAMSYSLQRPFEKACTTFFVEAVARLPLVLRESSKV